ncbi:MAG: pirin family protein, partial [Firmicutes bacterium]|nr:pirin family protein [Bacillota bacterium]
HYQAISSQQIPAVAVGKSVVRVIAGEYLGHKGPAVTYTPVNVWDVRVKGGETLELPQPDGWTLLLLVQAGTVQVNDDQPLHQGQLLTLSREGQGLRLEASSDARVLLMGGQPIEEPIVGYGPFVMNTEEEIRQAVSDFNNGKFGQMP